MTPAAPRMSIDLSWVDQLAELDDEQVGSLRRIFNLSEQLPGDWSGMHGFESWIGEDFKALRFQLAYMSYVLSISHVNHLPAAPGYFKEPFANLVTKILHSDCWAYWSNVSQGGGIFNSIIGERPQAWDPVAKDNIMYSAYLQSMTLLFHYLFQDDRYAHSESLRMELKPMSFKKEGFSFAYDENSLNELIFWQMAEHGFLGVPCEPNNIFQICNQPPLIGFRMHDLVYGGDLADEASRGYVKAWEEFGMVTETGDFRTIIREHDHESINFDFPQLNFWLMALLNAWNPQVVRKQYPILLERALQDGPDGTRWVKSTPLPHNAALPHGAMDFGWTIAAASEVGDTDTVNRMLAYADRFYRPTWQDGGLFYKRCDDNYNEDGYAIGVDPMASNCLIGWGRLNVENGLQNVYEHPFDDQHFASPALTALPRDVDVRRAIFDHDRNALVITLGKALDPRRIQLEISYPPGRGRPTVYRDGLAMDSGVQSTDSGIAAGIDHRNRTTLVFQW